MDTNDVVIVPEEREFEEWASPTRRAFVPMGAVPLYANSAGWWRFPWRGTEAQVLERGFKPSYGKPLVGLD